MADTKISAMTPATVLLGPELIPVVQSGANKSATVTVLTSAVAAVTSATSTVNPTVNNDAAAGFLVGSSWVNSVTGGIFICRSNTTGAAVWQRDGVFPFSGYISGNYYYGADSGVAFGTGAAVSNTTLRLSVLTLKERVTITELGARISAVSAGGNMMLGIYAANPATGLPTGNPLASVVGVSTGTSGAVTGALAGPVTLEADVYFTAIECDNTVATFTVMTGASPLYTYFGNSTLANMTNVTSVLQVTNTYGTFPNLTSATITSNSTGNVPPLLFKVA